MENIYSNSVFLAEKYNASGDKKQLNHWAKNYTNADTTIKKLTNKEQLATLQKIREFVPSMSKQIFSKEMNSVGIDTNELSKIIERVVMVESSMGINTTSKTNVVGLMQVTTNTAKDLIKQNIVGKKALALLGINKNTSDIELRQVLKTEEGSLIFGTGKLLQIGMTMPKPQSKFTNSESQRAYTNVLAENDLASNQQFLKQLHASEMENSQIDYKNGAFSFKPIEQETV